MAGRAATTKMGEVLLMKMFGEEIHHLFATVKKIIAKHHSKEIAARVHKVLIRITIKVFLLTLLDNAFQSFRSLSGSEKFLHV
jgi:hypothetical protein